MGRASRRRWRVGLRLLALFTFVVAATAVLDGTLPGAATAAAPCWERVIADWSENGRVDRTYPLRCYHEAVRHMPEDLRAYSSAPAEIDRALAERRAAAPSSSKTAAPLPAATSPARGTDLATFVPPCAGVLVAAGVGWWLVRGRRRPAGDR